MKEEQFLVEKYGTKILIYKSVPYIACALRERKLIYNIMEWYKRIGEDFNTTSDCIERNIRHFRSKIDECRVNQEFLNSLILEFRKGE